MKKTLASIVMGLSLACGSPKGWVVNSSQLSFVNPAPSGSAEIGREDTFPYTFHVEDAKDITSLKLRIANLDTGFIYELPVDMDNIGMTPQRNMVTLLDFFPRGLDIGTEKAGKTKYQELTPGRYRVTIFATVKGGDERFVAMSYYTKKE